MVRGPAEPNRHVPPAEVVIPPRHRVAVTRILYILINKHNKELGDRK